MFNYSFFENLNSRVESLTDSVTKLSKDKVYIFIKCPGRTKEDIKISVKDKILTVKSEEKEEKVFAFEIKTFFLSRNHDDKNIKGSIENGLLKITVPLIQSKDRQILLE